MWLLISADGRIMASHGTVNAWPVPPGGMTTVEYGGTFPAYADGVGEPNEYLWDGAAPQLDPGRPTLADRVRGDLDRTLDSLSPKERQLAKLLFLLVNDVRGLKGQQPITRVQFISMVAGL